MGGQAIAHVRVRIKGRKASVLRFFSISVAYTILWIMLTSELGYLSKLYGPQVLLQLNLAYYLPSIPVLLLAGQVERLLDMQFGKTKSMLLRLTSGLLGCAAICASFPFLPSTLLWLLSATAVIGALSAIAFSTSYQLVAWFRSADTIALGIGCVGSGPLVLAIHIALGMVGSPAKWQWICLFEIGAAFVLLGLVSSLSLFWQYWTTLAGDEEQEGALQGAAEGADQEQPLLAAAERDDPDSADATGSCSEASWALGWGHDDNDEGEAALDGLMTDRSAGHGSGSRLAHKYLTPRLLSFVGPFQGMLWTPGILVPTPHQARPQQPAFQAAIRRAASFESERSFAGLPQFRMPGSEPLPRSRSMGQHAFHQVQQTEQPSSSMVNRQQHLKDHRVRELSPDVASSSSTLRAVNDALAKMAASSSSQAPATCASAGPKLQTVQSDSFAAVAQQQRHHQQQHQHQHQQQEPQPSTGHQQPHPASSGQQHQMSPESPKAALSSRSPSPSKPLRRSGATNSSSCLIQLASPRDAEGIQTPREQVQVGAVYSRGHSPASDVEDVAVLGLEQQGLEQQQEQQQEQQEQQELKLSFAQENAYVFSCIWTVVIGALISSTVLNLLFPFFTYVPTSGSLGDLLPQALFYARIFSDITGRFLPRRKALALNSPYLLFALALTQLLLATLFLVYIRALPWLVHDWASIAIVVVLWGVGGYVNTNSYILAPGMVPAARAGRASAIMALTYQVAHFLGLMLALLLAWGMYGSGNGIA